MRRKRSLVLSLALLCLFLFFINPASVRRRVSWPSSRIQRNQDDFRERDGTLEHLVAPKTMEKTIKNDTINVNQQTMEKTVKNDTIKQVLVHSNDNQSTKLHQGIESLEPTLRWNSEKWAPMIIKECYKSFAQSAPCLLKAAPQTTFIDAQEIVYPAFKLSTPVFISKAHQTLWLEAVSTLDRMRVSNDLTTADYPTFFGQNLIFKDVLYKNPAPSDAWDPLSCMEAGATHSQFIRPLKSSQPLSELQKDSLIIATSPDSWSFQHFLDRVSVVYAQSLLYNHVTTETVVLTGSDRRSTFVDALFQKMGVREHVHYKEPVYTKKLIFSCRAPLVHPYTTQRASELFGVDILKTPIKERNIVLYLSRKEDVSNSGRDVKNENDLLDALRELLKKRDQGEELVVFDRRKYKSVEALVEYMSGNVRAMIGPHGSAFHNARFASKHTLLVEFMPIGRFQPCFWEQARLMEQEYVCLMLRSLNGKHDMEVDDIDGLMNMIDEKLGKEVDGVAKTTYPWKVDG